MSTDLDTRIRRTADAWERSAPPIRVSEITARSATRLDRLDVAPSADAVVVALAGVANLQHHQHRRATLAIFGVAAAALLAGIIVITSRPVHAPAQDTPSTDEAPQPSAATLPDTTAPPATTASTAPATTASTAPITTASIAPITTATDVPFPALTGTPSADTLDDVRSAALQALAELSGFTATATVRTTSTGEDGSVSADTPSTNTMTVMANGSLWATGDLFTWTSYDSSSGVTRDETTVNGVSHYQQIDGWADNQTAMAMLFGTDPTAVTGLTDPSTTVQETTHLGAPAWLLTMHQDPFTDDGPSTDDAWVIDKATGLVVQHTQVQDQANGTMTTTASDLTTLATAAALPPEFPGSFPDNAVVERSGDPSAGPLADVATAVARFGQAFYAPSGAAVDHARLSVTTGVVSDANGQDVPSATLTVTFPTGFLRPSIHFDAPLVVGFPADPSLPTLTSGAFAGHPYILDRTLLTIIGAPIGITLYEPTGRALALANSLVLVSGQVDQAG